MTAPSASAERRGGDGGASGAFTARVCHDAGVPHAAPLPTFRRAGAPRVEPLPFRVEDPHAFALACRPEAPALLETGGGEGPGWHVVPLAPRGALRSREGRTQLDWDGAPRAELAFPRGLDALRALSRALSSPRPSGELPFAGGLVLLLCYDLAHEIERLPRTTEDRDEWPWLVAIACPAAVLVDSRTGEARLAWIPDEGRAEAGLRFGLDAEEAAALRARVVSAAAGAAAPEGGPAGETVALATRAGYEAMVRAVLEHLHAGDIYQANVSQRFETPWSGSALPLYSELRRRNPSPQSGWMIDEGRELVVNSPERLVRLRGRELLTEPIAGTVPLPRGPETPRAEAAALARELVESRKCSAEHVMIVDIHRNDLGRVSAPGTVHVPRLMRVDRRAFVLQAVADIRGTLDAGKDAVDVIEAVFPGGCITGVPKIRCMEILDGLERAGRGPYTGAFGHLASWGDLDLAVLIRSAWLSRGRLAHAAGGGIVLDSDPGAEWEESLAKARSMALAIDALRAGARSVAGSGA